MDNAALVWLRWLHSELAMADTAHTHYKIDGGYESIDYYGSTNMWQLQDQNVHFEAYSTHCDLDPDLMTPKFEAFIVAPKSVGGKSLVKFLQQIPKISRQQGQKVHFRAYSTPLWPSDPKRIIFFYLINQPSDHNCLYNKNTARWNCMAVQSMKQLNQLTVKNNQRSK